MDRRGFLRSLIGGVAAAAAVRTFRVFSFPHTLILSNLEHQCLLVGEEYKIYGGARGGGKNLFTPSANWHQKPLSDEVMRDLFKRWELMPRPPQSTLARVFQLPRELWPLLGQDYETPRKL